MINLGYHTLNDWQAPPKMKNSENKLHAVASEVEEISLSFTTFGMDELFLRFFNLITSFVEKLLRSF